MSAQQIVDLYYDAWINKQGDMSGVPLAANFKLIYDAQELRAALAAAG
jgi:hypothetical protein